MTEINGKTVKLITHRLRKTAETCPKHPKEHLVYLDGFKKMKPFCQICQYEKNIAQEKQMVSDFKVNQIHGFLKAASLVDRQESFNYKFDNFKAKPNTIEAKAKNDARLIAGYYLKYPNKKGNSLFYGNAGAGKTHLAMAILNAVNDNANPMVKCLFISVNKLISEMRTWFQDGTGKWSPKGIIEIVRKSNLVVLDDLGAESVNTQAKSYVQEIILEIFESNQRIITTTNLSMDELYRTYHSRLVSRMQEGDRHKVIDFSKIDDKRSKI